MPSGGFTLFVTVGRNYLFSLLSDEKYSGLSRDVCPLVRDK
jgi:hypothetical protein